MARTSDTRGRNFLLNIILLYFRSASLSRVKHNFRKA
jgi:hypothetical protein